MSQQHKTNADLIVIPVRPSETKWIEVNDTSNCFLPTVFLIPYTIITFYFPAKLESLLDLTLTGNVIEHNWKADSRYSLEREERKESKDASKKGR